MTDLRQAESDDVIDLAEIRAKYRAERDKRLRADGNSQYVEVTGKFRHFVEDNISKTIPVRDPLTDETDVLMIGCGYASLTLAAKLRDAGVEKIRMMDIAGDFGGTWYWNQYPGAQCDVESYIYMPLLEETGFIPTEKYASGPELLDHARRIAVHYDLYRDAYFKTQVQSMVWLEDECKWQIETDRGDKFKARFVVSASGPLNRPKLPAIPGIEDFEGATFHTSRWDYDYTGGDSTGNLTKLADKKIAIIGTGATGVQCMPFVAYDAEQVYVFQRTPSAVGYRNNSPTEPDWAKSLTPGWQQRRRENFAILVTGGKQDEDLVNDGWTDIFRKVQSFLTVELDLGDDLSPEEQEEAGELADAKNMNEIRARIDQEVNDPATAEALKPWYRQWCKRPTFNDNFLAAFNRDNVTLIDTQGRGPDSVTRDGIVFDDQEYKVDCIVFATGFETGTDYSRRAEYRIVGRNGVTLKEAWKDGYRTLHGFYSNGFPNLLHMGIGQNGWTVNYTHMVAEQAHHIAAVISGLKGSNNAIVEPRIEAEDDWVKEIRTHSLLQSEFFVDCTPGYINNEGRPKEKGGISFEQYGKGPIEFFRIIKEEREAGLPGLNR